MASVTVSAEYIGISGGTGIYRIDLSKVGLSGIQSITFHDDNARSGGTSGASGADIDFVKLSTTSTASAPQVSTLAGLDAFDFSGNGVVYHPGYMRQWTPGDDPLWYSSYLFGTTANVYNPAAATLGVRDGAEAASQGTLSLGDGGQVSFLLKNSVPTGYGGSTDPRYLYFGEYKGDDQVLVTLSDERVAPAHSSNVTLYGTPSADSLILARGGNAHLGAGHDYVFGMDDDDIIFTWSGNDRLYGGKHNDKLYGEAGHDRLYGGPDNDWLYGGKHNDFLYGETGHDRLYGEAGKDYLHGGNDHDWLYGGLDNDTLYGGSGKDCFVFNTKLGTAKTDRKIAFDKILDLNVKYDSIWLDNKYFKKLGKGTEKKPLKINKKFFKIGEKAGDKDDYLIYNKKTGILSYDIDGSGSKQAVEFALLKKGLKITYNDLFVI